MTTSAIKELDDLIKKNPHLNIGQMNFQNPATLSRMKGSKKSKAKALPHLLALQRLCRTVNEPKIAKNLLKKGLDSAADIAALTEEEFVAHYAKAFSGNKEQAARKAHRTARARHAQALLHDIKLKQQAEPHYQASSFSDETPSNEISLEDSNQASSTETSEPRYSVLSPMAYFLELKKFKNNNLTGNPKYPFTERRSDIESLSPQTPHAEEEVPYLNVVNEVLEEQIPKAPYEQLAEAKYPFNLPFNLPLTKTHHYLHYLKTDLPTLYQSFAKEIKPEINARDYLKLSTKEYEYLTTPVSNPKELNPFYGLESGANPVEILLTVNTFLEKTGLTRDELQTLLFQNLHPAEIEAGIAGQFFINTTKENSKTYIIIVEEGGLEKLKLKTLGSTELKPLTLEHLDRLNRFIRLARKIGWSFTELNWVITSSCQNKLDQDKLDQEALTRIAAIKHLQEITQQPLDLLCSFWADLKSIGLGDKPVFQFEDLFDRTFNSRVAQEHKSYLPQKDKPWQEVLYKKAGATPYNKVDEHWKPRLAAALGIDRTDVDRIEEYLKPDAPSQTPNLQNLSLLFRYAKISQALNLSVEDFLLLLDLIHEDETLLAYNPFPLFMDRKPKDKVDTHALLKGTAAPPPENLPQTLWLIELLIGIVQWLKAENLTVPQLSYLKTGHLHRRTKPLLDQEQRTHLFQQLHHEFQNILVTPHSFESENVTPAEAKQIFHQFVDGGYIQKKRLISKTEPSHRYPATFFNIQTVKDRTPISTRTESLYFNGKDAYIDCGEIDLTNKSFTIECWVKRNKEARTRWCGVLGHGNDSLYLGFINDNDFRFGFHQSQEICRTSPTDDNWHHWACVYLLEDKHFKLSLYLDGEKIITSNKFDKPPKLEKGNLVIGHTSWRSSHQHLLGSIAEVRIWDHVRDEKLIKEYKNCSLIGNETGLLNYQPLPGVGKYIDEEGVILKTEPPHRYPATFFNTQAVKDRTPISTHTESLYFNGKDAYIDCGEIDLTNKSFTIECCVKRGKEARNRGDGVLGVGFKSLFLGFITTNNGHYFRFYFADGKEVIAEELIDGNWHHWACVYHLDDAKVELSLYLDGKKISSGKFDKPDPIKGKLVIGRSSWWPDHTSLLGSIGEVRIWNHVRSENQIKTYKNLSLIGNEPGLLNYQPLGSNIIYTKLQTLAKRQAQTLFKGLGMSHHVTSLNLIQTLSRIASTKSSDQEIVALVMIPILEGKKPSEPFFDQPEKKESFDRFFNSLQHYVSLFQQLNLGEREAQTLFTKPNCFHIADIKKLAVSHLKTVTDLRQLAATFDHPTHPLIGYFKSEPEKAAETLAKITEWKKDEIKPLLERFFGDPNPAYLRISALLKLKTCFDLSHQLGAEPSTLLKKVWEKAWPESGARQKEDMAKALFSLLKTQTNETERPALREALDQLINREKREALIGYVIHQLQTRTDKPRPHIKTPRDLYDYLLIDVAMGEAARTSRLLEAISCLQLYLHRCRLHLEDGVVVGAGLDHWWPIMKSYRLWEAKERILLYPENYIKPELRQDKTPLFKTLEDDLQQTDITDANVETAFKKYLDGFSEVAHLKIFGSHVYIDPAYPNDKMLILLGRGHIEPRKIYYRTARCLKDSPAIQWEPWEEIKLSIPAEQVYPVYAFGKIFIFWIELKLEKNPGEPNKPKYAHYAKLFYSFHNFNQDWSHPQQLGEKIPLQDWTTEPPKAPDWAQRLYPVYNAKTNQELYLFYQEKDRATEGFITYKDVLKISPKLDLEVIKELSIPISWISNTLPEVNNKPVIMPDPSMTSKHITNITNQPDWFIFQAKGDTFLLKPNYNKQPIGNAIGMCSQIPVVNRGCAVQISNKESYIKIASAPKGFNDYDLSMTFEGWFKFNASSKGYPILYAPEPKLSPKMQYYLLYIPDGHCHGLARDYLFNIGIVKINQWVHLAVTRDEKGNSAGYINGVKQVSYPKKEPIYYALTPLWLGVSEENSPFFMSEVRIWKITRTQAQIKEAMNRELSGKEAGLIGYWRLNEGEGTKVNSFNNLGIEGIFKDNGVTWAHFDFFAICSEEDYQSDNSTHYDIVRLTSNAVSTLSHNLLTGGMSSLLKRSTQETKELPAFAASPSKDQIGYTSELVRTVPSSKNLGFSDADGIYYWEIFFHGPFLLAERLNTAQHFNQAQAWYQHIFNPTIKENPWQFLPLRQEAQAGAGTLHNPQWIKTKHPFKLGQHEMLYFNGDAYINCGVGIDLKNKPFTIEFWVKRDKITNDKIHWIICQGIGEKNKGLHVCFYTKQHFHFDFYGQGTWSEKTYTDTTWHHWAVVYDKGKTEQRIYCDGKEVPKSLPNCKDYEGSGELFIGKATWTENNSNCPFSGYIAEVRIWNYALKSDEIEKNWNKPCIGSEAGLIRYWPLEKVDGNTVPNYARGAHQKNDVVNNKAAVVAFAENPFEPQAIAQIRPLAFKKAIGMRYIDTLIDHGDSLFRRYTYETIVEATLYYIMAFDLLGPQPVRRTSLLSQRKAANGSSPTSLEQEILSFENGTNGDLNLLNQALDDPHFFLPENTHFLGYWDRVQDRLYKIRHSLNIDGVRQSLPLFQPSIDPAALLKRTANGLVSDSPLLPLADAILPYRFTIVLAKAQNLAAQVTQFGGALLSALEKKDAEALALLRNTQESALLKMTRSMKESQIEASKETVQSLTAGLAQASARQKYYTQLLEQGLSPAEISQIVNMSIAQVFNILSGITRTAAAAGHIIPENAIMAGLTPNIITSFGGTQIGGALSAISSNLGIVAEQFSFAANMSSLVGGFQRRAQEWELQKTLATHDITQIERQIESAKWQQKIAERDLEILDKNIEQNTEIDSFLADKFTNHELYQWMAGKLAGIYFQSFQMAHDLALSSQRAFQFELTNNATFIDSAYWDGLKKGLLAGEILQVDLNRMEKAYLERNVRRFEIEKTVSLFELDPKALLNLKRIGTCDFHLTELIFSRDFPGHYSRQIKNISVSFPAVVGPYQNIYATLSQRVHRTLIEADIGGVKFLLGVKEDQPTTIRQDWRQNQRVALSRGLDDSGLFQLNFQDERYLPFEGTGAVSSWNLELNPNSINLNNLTDVIIKIEYTALTGDETFKQEVIKALPKTETHSRLFLIAQEFGDAWRQFLATNTENKTLTLFLKKSMFLALTDPQLTGVYLQLELTEEGKEAVKKKPTITLKVGTHDKVPLHFDTDGVINKEGLKLNSFQEVDWTFTDNNKFFTDKHVANMALIVTYGAKTEGNETRIFSGGTTRGGVRQSEHKLVVPRAKNKVAVKRISHPKR